MGGSITGGSYHPTMFVYILPDYNEVAVYIVFYLNSVIIVQLKYIY